MSASTLISISQPAMLAFGIGAFERAAQDLKTRGLNRLFIVSSSITRGYCDQLASMMTGPATLIWDKIDVEPTMQMFEGALNAARDFQPDAIIGLGGGSPMDVAKLVAAILDTKQNIHDVFGIGKVSGRTRYLACLPTTAGTGSEVSPNAILLDEAAKLKKGVVSPFLMPDAAYVDPKLTVSVPPAVTASTGMDALTHCIEAYANRFAHPVIDLYAIEGVKLISRNLKRAFENGDDLDARTAVALGSMYGGICLGPVNTGAVHALAYPLGGEFKIAHGVSNSLLLPHVLEYNLPAAVSRYADIARAMGVNNTGDESQTAHAGLAKIRELSLAVKIPAKLSSFNIPESAIEGMAKSAMTVTRLLERNVRQLTIEDAISIYRRAF
jgi:alcohol dehydrogenase class IV